MLWDSEAAVLLRDITASQNENGSRKIATRGMVIVRRRRGANDGDGVCAELLASVEERDREAEFLFECRVVANYVARA